MHPLKQQLAEARREVRRLLVVHGAARVVSVAVALAALLALVDCFLRFDDRGVRWLCSVALLAAIAWAVIRFLLPALRQPLGNVALAGKIERRFAAIGDHLSSTIEFVDSREDDPLAGSAELRRAAVAQAEAEIRPFDWREAIDRGPTIRAAAVAVAIVVVAVAMLIARPADARIALTRLLDPLSDAGWPPANDLAFVHPVDRIAYGQPFEVELKDRNGKLPDAVKIQYRTIGNDRSGEAEPAITSESMQRIGDLMVARKEHVTRSFDYRAEGGDDRRMAWIHVDVVEPPRIDSLSIMLHPPTYTGWPAQPAERRIVALRGTAVEMIGKSSKPLRAATLHLPGGSPILAGISADGRAFTIPLTPTAADRRSPRHPSPSSSVPDRATRPFVVETSGSYWFELQDREGLSGGEADRWDIEAIKDQPPSVSFTEPEANLLVTPAATVNTKLAAKDDLALRTVGLIYTRSDRSDLGEIALAPLLAGPEHVAAATAPVDLTALQPDSRTFQFAWQLGPMGLKPGTNLTLSAAATDYAGQRTTSLPRRIAIISAEEFDEHLAQRESAILNELARLLKLEQASRQETASFETQVERVGRFARGDVDQLRSTELNQRQIRRGLVGSTEGVRASVVGVLQELASNHVDNPVALRRMQTISDGLARLDENELPAAEQSLTSALKAAEDAPPSAPLPAAGRRALDEAGRLQQSIAAALETMLDEMSEWNSFRGLARQLAQIRRDQAELQQSTKAIGGATLTSDVQELNPQQQADLKKLGDRQSDLARQLDKLIARMAQVATQLSAAEPLSAQSLADALDVARRKTPSAAMLAAADDVDQNLLGKALGQQAVAGTVLDEILDILANRRDQELSRLVAKLRDAEQQLAAIRAEQEGLHKQLVQQTSASPPKSDQQSRTAELQRLTRQQQEVAKRTEQLARQLERLQAQQASDATKQAASAMHAASQAAANNANRAAEHSDSAKKNLEEAQRQLADARRKAEADLAEQQLGRLEDSLKGLVDSQQHAIGETLRLERLRTANGDLSRGQVQSVLDLARQQQSLSADTDGLAGRLVGVDTFQFVLQAAARDMRRTAERLTDRDTAAATQQLEHDVLLRLQELIEAMKQPAPPPSQPQQSANKPGQPGQKPTGNARSLAEIRLIRLMQDDLNRRTRRLDESIGTSNTPNDSQRQEFSELTEEQGRIAELMVKLAGAGGDNGSPNAKDSTP